MVGTMSCNLKVVCSNCQGQITCDSVCELESNLSCEKKSKGNPGANVIFKFQRIYLGNAHIKQSDWVLQVM